MKLTKKDFAESFGTTIRDIRQKCNLNMNFTYSIIKNEELINLISFIKNKIKSDEQVIGSPHRKQVWDNGWKDNLKEFIKKPNTNSLIPKFIRSGQPIRYRQQFIKTSNLNFELDFYKIFREWLFKTFLNKYKTIYEFGCGTGFNLVELAHLYPEKKLYGLDFVPSSINLINKIRKHYNFNITGILFDMIHPDTSLSLKPNSGVLTIGTIEQLANKFESFITYLLKNPISICIHIEPIYELYDKRNLVDSLAMKFHKKRGYTDRFLNYLKQMEQKELLKILKIKRLYFGSLFMEGYSLIIWIPKHKP